MFEEAKALIELGLPIIPLCPPDHAHMSQLHLQRCRAPGKTPLIKDWTTKNVTTIEELQSWQRQFKNFNIGMPLGQASGLVGIDVDGQVGVQLLMEMSDGVLPSTWEFTTSAGSRLLYRIPAGLKTKKFKQQGSGKHEECALICDGQQTVMPPSKHISGATYQWVAGHSPKDIDCAMAPQWLIDAIRLEEGSTAATTIPLATQQKKPQSDGFDFASEFGLSDEDLGLNGFTNPEGGLGTSFDLPPDVPTTGTKGGGKKRKTPEATVTEEMLTTPIPEGNRDNTMTAIVGHYCANRDLRRLGKDMILDICLKHNQTYCQPPLEDQAIIDKVNFFFNAEAAKDAGFKQEAKPKFEATLAAKNVIKHLKNQGIILQYDQFQHQYYYTMESEGPWQSTHNNTLINRWIREVIISPHYGDPSFDKRSYVDETRTVIEEMFTSPFKKYSDFDLGAHSEELCKYIVVNDGMLDWKTGEIKPWDPKYHTTIAFDIDYDVAADCPHWEEYLAEWLPDENVRKVVQEYLGYCLIPNTNFRKALFLYGKGRNGKSIFIEYLQEIFGDLSSTLSYDALFQRFGPANLKDKLVNIYDDTNVSFAKDTGIAKNLIAGGTISAEFKGKDHFTFTNVARIIFSAQETPRTADNTLAWYDRWFFVKFPNTFRASNSKKEEMFANLRKERSGIFNWMIEGLKRLMLQDGFSRSSTLSKYTEEYRGMNDTVMQFITTYCRSSSVEIKADRVSCAQMYAIYQMLAEKDNLRPVSAKIFRQRLEDYGYPVTRGEVGQRRTTFFAGLSLNEASEELQDNMIEVRVILSTKT